MTEQFVIVLFILALLFVGGLTWVWARAKARQFVRRGSSKGSIGGGSSNRNRHRADDDFWPASGASFGAGSFGGSFGGGSCGGSSSGGGCDSGGF